MKKKILFIVTIGFSFIPAVFASVDTLKTGEKTSAESIPLAAARCGSYSLDKASDLQNSVASSPSETQSRSAGSAQ